MSKKIKIKNKKKQPKGKTLNVIVTKHIIFYSKIYINEKLKIENKEINNIYYKLYRILEEVIVKYNMLGKKE